MNRVVNKQAPDRSPQGVFLKKPIAVLTLASEGAVGFVSAQDSTFVQAYAGYLVTTNTNLSGVEAGAFPFLDTHGVST